MSDDLKELLSHLRAVHFALVGTMFAILVVGSLGRDATLQRASDQLSRVAGLNQVLSIRTIAAAVSAASQGGVSEGLSLHEQRTKLLWRVDSDYHDIREAEFPLPRPKLWIPSESSAYSPPFDYPIFVLTPPESRTFRDFQLAWQFLLNGKRAFVVSAIHPESATFQSDNSRAPGTADYSESIVDRAMAPSHPDVAERAFLVNISITTIGSNRYAADFALVGGKTSDPHLRFGRHAIIPIEVRSSSIDVMEFFLKDASGLGPEERAQSNRPFAEVFKELSSTALGLESLKIEEMRSYIGRLLREKGPDVELFGAKIPQDSLVYWSLPALLTIQIYFLTTLRQLLSRYAAPLASAEFTWIALYCDPIAKVATQISFVGAPVVALIVTADSSSQRIIE
jgi:hypothetical protein